MKRLPPLIPFVVLLSACPKGVSSQGGVAGATTELPDSAGAAEDSLRSDYRCLLVTASEELRSPCQIVETAEGRTFRLQSGAYHIEGRVEQTGYGFRLEGRFNEQALAVDVYRQGQGHFAASMQVEGQGLFKLNLAPP